ncbi:MAG TPA: cyclase family protein, partial [Blastocatellia bacterium]|nr:cyclase family protein [Blastocatellia bacterium]
LPIHQLVLVAMGVNIFDNCDLEALSEAAAKRNRWEFLLTASPLAVPGGTGSPLNPIATF